MSLSFLTPGVIMVIGGILLGLSVLVVLHLYLKARTSRGISSDRRISGSTVIDVVDLAGDVITEIF